MHVGRPECLLMLTVPKAPPDPVPAPLRCSAEGSRYSLSRQGSQTVWLTPQGCTTPSPRLQALQHSPLVVYILVKHLSLEPQAGPWERKQTPEVTLVVGPPHCKGRWRHASHPGRVLLWGGHHLLNKSLGRNGFPMQNLLTKKAAAKCCCWREVRKAHDSTVRAGGCF